MYVKVLLVACPAGKGTFPGSPSPQLTPTLWFLLHCNQTWHQLLSGEVVSFPEDNGQGPPASGGKEGFHFQTGQVLGFSRNWNREVGGRRWCEQISHKSPAVFRCHLLSSSLLSKWLTDFPWSWLRFPGYPFVACSSQLIRCCGHWPWVDFQPKAL